MNQKYRKQLALLLDVLPEIAREEDLALHGGTAINLFVRDMPRLSVDIDLTFIPVLERADSFQLINDALKRIKRRLHPKLRGAIVQLYEKQLKLQILHKGVHIKIEVNQINRGCIDTPITHSLCEKAQDEFDAFCEIKLVSFSQLFGGKMIAGLDRQHPRDIFDLKLLMDEEGISEILKPGLVLFLLSSNRPIYELLNPIKKNLKNAFEDQFAGMTDEPFSYEDFENTREKLIAEVNKLLGEEDKQFLVNFKKLTPDWSVYNLKDFPAVKWKMKNLEVFRKRDREAYDEAVGRLKEFFGQK